jgi:hypothetical protein
MKSPIGCVYFLPFGAVSSTAKSDILLLPEFENARLGNWLLQLSLSSFQCAIVEVLLLLLVASFEILKEERRGLNIQKDKKEKVFGFLYVITPNDDDDAAAAPLLLLPKAGSTIDTG